MWVDILDKVPTKMQEFYALIFQNIWLGRNSFIFDNYFAGPKQVVELAILPLESFQSAQIPVEGDVLVSFGCRP